ncbi:MAG: hypothetical protein AAF390_00665 [Pseudomonadota bacterium]
MTDETRARTLTAEKASRINIFGAAMVGTAIGGYAVVSWAVWGIVLLAGIAMLAYAACLRRPGDEDLVRRVCTTRSMGEVVLCLVGLLVLAGSVVGAVLLPSLLWIAVGLGGLSVAIRYRGWVRPAAA